MIITLVQSSKSTNNMTEVIFELDDTNPKLFGVGSNLSSLIYCKEKKKIEVNQQHKVKILN